MTRLLPPLALAFLLFTSACPAEPPAKNKLEALIADLDAEDPAVRYRAAGELARLGEGARPALEKVAKTGSPEAAQLAARALREMKALALLKTPAGRPLAAKIDAIRDGEPAARREAVRAWVHAVESSPATVDVLIDLMRHDPAGPYGDAAGEALNWLCARGGVERLAGQSISMMFGAEKCGAAQVKDLEDFGVKFRISDEARPLIAAVALPARADDDGKPMLDEIRMICRAAGIACRIDPATGEAVLETPEQSLAAWEAWWKETRRSDARLMELGLKPQPDASGLKEADLDAWIAKLDAPDAAEARSARHVLRNLGDALLPAFHRKAAGHAGAELLGQVLRLRKEGRVVFSRQGREGGVYVMNLDGSGLRRVTDAMEEVRWTAVTGDRGWVLASVRRDEQKSDMVRFPLRGSGPGEILERAPGGLYLHPTQGTALVLRNAGGMEILDVVTGRSRELTKEVQYACATWAPDGSMIAANTGTLLHLVDPATGKVREFSPCKPVGGVFAWSPDSSTLAWCHVDLDIVIANCLGRPFKIVTLDVRSGQRQELTPARNGLGKPAWSPDGKRLAFTGYEGEDPMKGKPTLEIVDVATRKSVIWADPVGLEAQGNPTVSWSPDGRLVHYVRHDLKGRAWLVDAATGAKTEFKDLNWLSTFLPGGEWILSGVDGDIVLQHRDGKRRVALTETSDQDFQAKLLSR